VVVVMTVSSTHLSNAKCLPCGHVSFISFLLVLFGVFCFEIHLEHLNVHYCPSSV
jgi:hypothetical protein